jgi:hypothetical protein
LLASAAPQDLERLGGMAFLNGIPVRLEPSPTTQTLADSDRGVVGNRQKSSM